MKISGELLLVLSALCFTAPANAMWSSENSRETPASYLYCGLWTVYLRTPDRPIENNHQVGVAWRGVYAGTPSTRTAIAPIFPDSRVPSTSFASGPNAPPPSKRQACSREATTSFPPSLHLT